MVWSRWSPSTNKCAFRNDRSVTCRDNQQWSVPKLAGNNRSYGNVWKLWNGHIHNVWMFDKMKAIMLMMLLIVQCVADDCQRSVATMRCREIATETKRTEIKRIEVLVIERLTATRVDFRQFNGLKRLEVQTSGVDCTEFVHAESTTLVMDNKVCPMLSARFNYFRIFLTKNGLFPLS